MPFADKLISIVGRMPFTAKHDARFFYTEATRAALRGDEALRRNYIGRLGAVAVTNDAMLVGGGIMAGITAARGVSEHSLLLFAEAAGAALYAVGHGASGVAQHLMVRRHGAQAKAIANRAPQPLPIEQSPPPPAQPLAVPPENQPRRITSPTMWERIVTNGGTAIVLAPVVQIFVDHHHG